VQVSATSGSGGRFEITGVPPRVSGVLQALTHAGDSPYLPATLQDVEAGRRDVVVVLSRGHRLAGTIRGENVAGLEIAFVIGAKRQKAVRTDPDGTFKLWLAEKTPGTLVVIDAKHNRYGLLDGVAPPQADISMVLEAGHEIRGRVEGPPNGGGLGILARAGPAQASVLVDPDGAFVLSGLPPGTYDLLVFAPGRGTLATRQGVASGSTGLGIEIPGE
jgi:hypothetical protein